VALVAIDLATEMYNSTLGISVPGAAFVPLANAISSYILANAELMFSWNGINPANGAVDPVVSVPGGIDSLVITLTSSGATTPGPGLAHFAGEITVGMQSGTVNVSDPTFILGSGVMADCPVLSLALAGETDSFAAYESLAGQVITWLQGYTPGIILLGSHGVFQAPPGIGAQALGPFL
jgi:hypothetical protein